MGENVSSPVSRLHSKGVLMANSIDSAIAKTNTELKAARCRVTIERRHDRLILRATFPPKPGSDRVKPHTQRLSIGIVYATPAGLRAARKQALIVSSQLDENTFLWSNWLEPSKASKPISDWIKEFQAAYFEKRGINPKVASTWEKDYQIPLNKLPPDQPLTSQVIIAAVAATTPHTRARQRYCMAYGALAKFAGVDVDLVTLKGSYSPKAVAPRDIPDDQLIEEWQAKIPDPRWQAVYRLMAAYGLRNHECWYIDLEKLKVNAIAFVKDGKTGQRLAIPYPVIWWNQWFKDQRLILPVLSIRKNADYGRLSAQYFKRLGLPFTLYTLRHAHAARMAANGVDGQLAAKIQGHSSKVHESIYLAFMDDKHYQALLDRQQD